MPGVSRSLTPSRRLDSLSLPPQTGWVGDGEGMLANITDIASAAIGSELPARLYIILSCTCVYAFIGSLVNIDTPLSPIIFYFPFVRDPPIPREKSSSFVGFVLLSSSICFKLATIMKIVKGIDILGRILNIFF